MGAVAGVAGTAAAIHYANLGLTLTHYDARAHLVVARRIFDSLTPGWQQVGAVWLPLPHVLNALPVQVDIWYRSGASAIAISVLSMALACGSLAALLLRTTGSLVAAVTGAALLMLNPNVLYLQSTPMTEPLLFGLCLLSVALTAGAIDRAVNDARPGAGARDSGLGARDSGVGARDSGLGTKNAECTGASLALAAACLTRYEAWPITAAVVVLAVMVMLRRGMPWLSAARVAVALSFWPTVAVIAFSMNSRWVIGSWFVPSDFFVPENVQALGNPAEAWRQIDEGLRLLSGSALVWGGYAGALLVTLALVRPRSPHSIALVLALAASAALPMYAYLQGHPFRIRYDLPLVIAAASLTAAGIAVLHRWARGPAAAVVLTATLLQASPLDHTAPLVQESQREAAAMAGRTALTDYLRDHYDGTTIMMSMGSLAHYMHDLSNAGFEIRNFLHEGNGEIWRFAMLAPRGHAGWLMFERYAEGGDAMFHAAQRPRWLEGFELVVEGGGVSLYRATK